MNLIIVESPTKARTLGRFLGRDYKVDSTMGHLKDLPKSKLGVDIKKNFEPQWVEVAKRQDTIKDLRQDAKKAKKIFLATDPDREGEAIAHHTLQLLKKKGISRIVFHEITKDAVERALGNPGKIDEKLVDAQQARRVLDRLVGYKLSPLLWRKVRRGLSAGRVQSVAVRLIVEREREIEVFKSEEYWEIFVEVARVKGAKEHFIVKLVRIGDKKAEVKNEKTAKEIAQNLKKSDFSVLEVEKKEVKKRPFPPLTTSTMTQSSANLFSWSSRRSMSVAQKLYEEGFITYHRTDSLNLSKEAIVKARSFIKKEYGEDYLPEEPRFYKTRSRIAQEAHEAIRPTSVARMQDSVAKEMGADPARLYGLIWRRFLASQAADALYDRETIKVKAIGKKEYELQVSGQIVKFDGWRKISPGSAKGEEPDLPAVSEGEKLVFKKVDPQQKFTEPPPRYTEASLIKTLEKLGIGRPSTYAPTISTIQGRQYVEKKEGSFYPTPVGIAVNGFLVKNFPDVFEYSFTAEMEEELDDIADGKRKWRPVIKEFWSPFSKKLKRVEEKGKRVKVEVEKTGDRCPKCGKGEQVVRVGRFGKFLSCSRFPDCDWTETYTEKIGMKCPNCKKGEIIIKKTRSGRQFYGCSRYPECKFASWKKPGEKKSENTKK